MDTSKQYVKLCEKAEEIQELAKERLIPPRKGVFYVEQDAYAHIELPDTGDLVYKYKSIWLPRQDQLQEMLPPIIPDLHFRYLLEEKTWYVTWMSGAQWEIYGSMEIIWLSIVMKLNYGKVWSGEEWLTSK